MVIHYVTFSGLRVCIFSTQKCSQYERSTTYISFLLSYVSNYNTHKKKHQSVAHNSLFPPSPQKKNPRHWSWPFLGEWPSSLAHSVFKSSQWNMESGWWWHKCTLLILVLYWLSFYYFCLIDWWCNQFTTAFGLISCFFHADFLVAKADIWHRQDRNDRQVSCWSLQGGGGGEKHSKPVTVKVNLQNLHFHPHPHLQSSLASQLGMLLPSFPMTNSKCCFCIKGGMSAHYSWLQRQFTQIWNTGEHCFHYSSQQCALWAQLPFTEPCENLPVLPTVRL